MCTLFSHSFSTSFILFLKMKESEILSVGCLRVCETGEIVFDKWGSIVLGGARRFLKNGQT